MPPFLRCIAAGLFLATVGSITGIACTHQSPCADATLVVNTCADAVVKESGRVVVYAAKPAVEKVVPLIMSIARDLF